MINLFNIKNSIMTWLAGAGAFIATLMLAFFTIRKGGRDAERQKHTETTLENVKDAQQVIHNVGRIDDTERKRLRKYWTKKRK